MINEETRRKLREINLGEAIKGLEVQQADPATIALPFDERMQRLVDYIYQEKYNGKIQRLIKSAKLRFPQANRQGVIYASRGLNRDLIENLFSGQYIGLHQSVILQGFTGSGKTYLACALGKEACLNHVRVRYVRLPDLLMEYGDSTVVHFLFELMERRSDTTSTIFCTQYRKDDWVKRLGEGVRAEAIVDRYAYTAFWIETGSTNMREYCAKHKM